MIYYNDNDPYVAQWLRNLIAAKLLPAGEVDERGIIDVRASDLRGFVQCHFFAGIGGWPYALRLAGWPDDEPVWTGSCPCQPLSGAGLRKGHADERHLWPAFYGLIAECAPAIVFGEQVASSDGREWLAGVRTDLEALGYACGCADLPAACAGSPQQRNRLYWVADTASERRGEARSDTGRREVRSAGGRHSLGGMGDAECSERRALNHARGNEGPHCVPQRQESSGRSRSASEDGVAPLGHAARAGLQGEWSEYQPSGERCGGLAGLAVQTGVPQWNGPTVAVLCSDGARRISAQPDAFPLAHGVSARMGKLRAYGNAIVPQVAAKFVTAFLKQHTAAA